MADCRRIREQGGGPGRAREGGDRQVKAGLEENWRLIGGSGTWNAPRRYYGCVTLKEPSMAPKDRVALCGRVGLILAAFALIGGVVAEPALKRLWSAPVTVAQR